MYSRDKLAAIASTKITRQEIVAAKTARERMGPKHYKYFVTTEMNDPHSLAVLLTSPYTSSMLKAVFILGFSTIASLVLAVILIFMSHWVWAVVAFVVSYLVFSQIQTSLNYELVGRLDAINDKLLDHHAFRD